jgi:predicted ArsR family transcriptional regulator
MRGPNYQKERGERQKQRILDLVASEPKTAKQLAEGIHLSLTGVLLHTKVMMRETPRRLHIAGWVPSSGGKPAPLYGLGDVPDAAYDPIRKAKLPDRVDTRAALIRKLLEDAPLTAEQLGNAAHLSPSRTRFYLRRLRDAGEVHIKGWEPPPGRGDLSPVYALGNRTDKKKPRKTRAETYRKEKSDPERLARLQAKRRARHTLEKYRKKPQGIFAALGL